MRQVLPALAACGAAVVMLAAAAAAFGHSPAVVLAALLQGAVGSPFALAATLLKMVPLLLTALSVVVAFRAGAWNIGAEGQFIIGGIAALLASPLGSAAALVAAALAGAAWASLASGMRLWRNAPEVLTTILLNFLALHVLGWCMNGPLRESSGQYPQSDPASSSLPAIGGVHVGVPLSILLAVGGWWFLYRTTAGLRLRATGLNAEAAQLAGIDTGAQLLRAMAISGAMAGSAGALELLGVTHRLFERFAAGYGYSGIAVALLGQLHPIGSVASSLFFAALLSGAGELQRSANVSASIATFGQAVVILMIIAFSWRRSGA